MVVLVVSSGGAAAAAARGGGVPGHPTDYFFFLAGPLADCRLSERRGAGGLARAGGERWPKTRVPRARGALADKYGPARRCTAAQFSSVSYMR